MAHSFAAPDEVAAKLLRLVAGASGVQVTVTVGGVQVGGCGAALRLVHRCTEAPAQGRLLSTAGVPSALPACRDAAAAAAAPPSITPAAAPAVSISALQEVEFEASGQKARGAHTAARFIASQGGAAAQQQLLGDSPEQQAKVAEWLSFQHTALGASGLLDARLAELNAALEARTYIAGGARPSLADLVLYAAVAPAAAAFPVAQHGHFCNLLRWCVRAWVRGVRGVSPALAASARLVEPAACLVTAHVSLPPKTCNRYDLLHHTADSQRLFPAATFVRPRYVAPPPPPPAEPKAAKAADGGKAAAAADGGKKGGDKAAAAAPAADGKKGGKAAAAAAAGAAAGAAAAAAGGKADKKVGGRCGLWGRLRKSGHAAV